MKAKLISGLAIMALVLALVVPVSACPKFSNSTLSGSYVMTINSDNRSNLTDNPSSAGAVLGLLSFDSKGNFRGNLTTTAGPTSGSVSGTYSINADGTGIAT